MLLFFVRSVPRWGGDEQRALEREAVELQRISDAEDPDFGTDADQLKGDTRMSAPKETNPGVAVENRTSEQQESKPGTDGVSRRTFLGVGSAGQMGRLPNLEFRGRP